MIIAPTIQLMADASSAAGIMHSFVAPVIRTMCVLASLVCVFFVVNGGFQYMTSAGKVEQLDHAKHILKNALIGLVIVLSAAVLTNILTHAYSGASTAAHTALPSLTALQPEHVSNGLADILIKAITGLLNNIIQAVAKPFLSALSFFTTSTPLMADNSSVFNLWIAMVGIADALFVLVVALLGFHVMSASSFGFDEIEFKHLLPRIALIFLLLNVSIFAIDGIIEVSNAMIKAINAAGDGNTIWKTLTEVVKDTGGQGVAALLIMTAFLIFSVILLVYYVGRLVTLFIGAVLSPIVLLLWLIPGFRDFSETAAKTYLATIFVLFVHVVILQLAASLFVGMAVNPSHAPDALMAMITGLATLIALLKTQGVMMQFSYASLGPRTARRLGGQFVNGMSYLGGKGKAAAAVATGSNKQIVAGGQTIVRSSTKQPTTSAYKQPTASAKPAAATKAKTGTTTVAPKLKTPSAETTSTTSTENFNPTKLNKKRRSKL